MKKVFMLFLAAGAISLAACGGGKDKDGGSSAASGEASGNNSGEGNGKASGPGSTNDNGNSSGPSAGNQDGDICDCLMAAMKVDDEEQAKACDPSKSEDELRAIIQECMSGGSKKEDRGMDGKDGMPGMDGKDGMPSGMDAEEMMKKAKDAMPEGFEMPEK